MFKALPGTFPPDNYFIGISDDFFKRKTMINFNKPIKNTF